MRKRIRMSQLCIGMYVEEVEETGQVPKPRTLPHLVANKTELDRLVAMPAISLVIDVSKGTDVGGNPSIKPNNHIAKIRADILRMFPADQIREAEATIDQAVPQIRQMLSDARATGTFRLSTATGAVESMMQDTISNSTAFFTILRLREHDEATFKHSLAVSALLVAFARQLGMPEGDILPFGIGGLVHDIGKSTLPRELLQKTSKLTEEEFAIIKTHSHEGYKMLSLIDGTHEVILQICRHHHEKFDGSGYPDGLKGDAIPLPARMAAICDVYDALTSIRPYKRAWTKTEALAAMTAWEGHFDPTLIGKFATRMVAGKLA